MSFDKIEACFFAFHLMLFGCEIKPFNSKSQMTPRDSTSYIQAEKPILSKEQIADAFDFPVGPPDGKGYYNAQPFGENFHLGDDWNAVTGGNTDLGDPVYAMANGKVSFAQNIGSGWGNIIRIIHYLPDGKAYESLYAHCDSLYVAEGAWVKRGEQIGTIGNADGMYLAHLHLEFRNRVNMDIGGGYAEDTTGYIDPTHFIHTHRVLLPSPQIDSLRDAK